MKNTKKGQPKMEAFAVTITNGRERVVWIKRADSDADAVRQARATILTGGLTGWHVESTWDGKGSRIYWS